MLRTQGLLCLGLRSYSNWLRILDFGITWLTFWGSTASSTSSFLGRFSGFCPRSNVVLVIFCLGVLGSRARVEGFRGGEFGFGALRDDTTMGY